MSDEQPKPADPYAVHPSNRRYVDLARARIRQLTGKQFVHLEAQLGALTGEAVLDLVRLVEEAQNAVTRAKRQAIHEPWRR